MSAFPQTPSGWTLPDVVRAASLLAGVWPDLARRLADGRAWADRHEMAGDEAAADDERTVLREHRQTADRLRDLNDRLVAAMTLLLPGVRPDLQAILRPDWQSVNPDLVCREWQTVIDRAAHAGRRAAPAAKTPRGKATRRAERLAKLTNAMAAVQEWPHLSDRQIAALVGYKSSAPLSRSTQYRQAARLARMQDPPPTGFITHTDADGFDVEAADRPLAGRPRRRRRRDD